MPPVGFETTISAGERPQTYALDRAATGTGASVHYYFHFFLQFVKAEVTKHKPGPDVAVSVRWLVVQLRILTYSRNPLTRINLDGEPSGYAENPDNCIFL